MKHALVAAVIVMGCSRGEPSDPFAGSQAPAAPAGRAHAALTAAEGRVVIDAPAPAAPGATVVAHVRVLPAHGLDINRKAPWKLTLDPSADVAIGKAVLTGGAEQAGDADRFADDELSVPVTLVPRAGAVVTGRFDFTVCAPDRCLSKTMPVAIQVATR